MKIGALPRREVAAKLKGPGLVFQIGRFDVSLSTGVSAVGEDIHHLYADYELSSRDDLVDFHVALKPVPGLRRWAAAEMPNIRYGICRYPCSMIWWLEAIGCSAPWTFASRGTEGGGQKANRPPRGQRQPRRGGRGSPDVRGVRESTVV